ncbi:hypothetical protein ONE63_004531 [Megalurothrips usitatus]|uniref:YqaJ viral recombinase domain-containing protein n=1 Tax=Megalurothrips usitatus TaxID=439358 RepID=A0AAV7X341_9NEOP|nr:hypothetical protein ONE63_004531 [Megalurothrips usitatus]
MPDIFWKGYKDTLQNNDLLRYEQLLQLCEGIDPFELDWKALSDGIELLPQVNIVDILQYLVYGVKSHTMAQIRAYKATAAYTFLNDGWVQGIRCHPVSHDKVLVLGKIKHSFRLNEPPARAWTLAETSGVILAGWCSCVAGRALRDVPYIPVNQYDLSTPEAKRKRLLREAESDEDADDPPPRRTTETERENAMVLTTEEVEELLGRVKVSDVNCALLRVSSQHSEEPSRVEDDLPPSFSTFYDEKFTTMTYEELLKECEKKFMEIKLTDDESHRIRMATVENGKKKEPLAREAYTLEMRKTHANFRVKEVGYFNIPQFVYLGASPDGLTKCDCCGKGMVEIKTRKRASNEIEERHMKQMQQQMLIVATLCDLQEVYCDYTIYRDHQPLYIERVYPDKSIQRKITEDGKERFIRLILPELLGRYYSSLKHLMNTTSTLVIVCYCMGPVRMPMAKCSNSLCDFTYFHLSCVGITRQRKNWNGWLCPQCTLRSQCDLMLNL